MSGTREEALIALYSCWTMAHAVYDCAAPPPVTLVEGDNYFATSHPFCELGRALYETIEEALGLEVLEVLSSSAKNRREVLYALRGLDYDLRGLVDAAEAQAIQLGRDNAAEMERLGLTIVDGKWVASE